MAWIIGLVSPQELTALREAGVEIADPPAELLSEDEIRGVADDYVTVAVFLDTDLVDLVLKIETKTGEPK